MQEGLTAYVIYVLDCRSVVKDAFAVIILSLCTEVLHNLCAYLYCELVDLVPAN